MPLLTPEQLQEIKQIIEDHHEAFVINTIGPDAVPADVLERLQEMGLVDAKLESIKDSYVYGQLMAMMQSDRIAGMGYEEFKRHLRKNPIPLSEAEVHALRMAQQNAGQYCKGLGNRVSMATGDILIEADAQLRAQTEGIIRDATALNIARREAVSKLKSDLGWAMRDWARDWARIANTEKNNAMQRGMADHYRGEYGGDVLVAKRPMPDACDHCKRLYLEGGEPIVFTLRELEANGTNVGRKANDWLPTVGPIHPNCQCQLIRVPDGWGFDEDGDLVPGGNVQRYGGAAKLRRAIQERDDMQKAFKLQDNIVYQGIPVAIENKKGTVRKWRDAQGGTGETKMLAGYGYVKRTNGIDEDEVDVFVGPDPQAKVVYIIEQQIPETGQYDEQKCMLGFRNQREAEQLYLDSYDRPGFKLYTTAMAVDQFRRWLAVTKPVKGEMLKSDSKLRLVLPLRKSQLGLFSTSKPAEAPPPVARKQRGGPYVGPRGGLWADPEHTIPWGGEHGGLVGQTTLLAPGARDVSREEHEQPVLEALAAKQRKAFDTAMGEYKAAGDDYRARYEALAHAETAGNHLVDVLRELGQVQRSKDWAKKVRKVRRNKMYYYRMAKSLDANVGAATSPMGNRNVTGFGANYITATLPEKPEYQSLRDVGYRPDSRELAEAFLDDIDAENPLKRDKAVYEFQETVRHVRPIEVPDEWRESQEQAREGHEERMERLKQERIINAGRPKNTAEIEEDEEGEE